MEAIRMLLENLDDNDVQAIIGVGLAYPEIANDNLLWKNKLKNAFGIDRFPHYLEKDESINWFHMYQKYRRQEVVLPDVLKREMVSYILPFPCVEVCDTNPSLPNSSRFLFLSLDGKVYEKRIEGDFHLFGDINFKVKKMLVDKNGFGYFLSEDDEVYFSFNNEHLQPFVNKIGISFKVMEIQDFGGNDVFCIGYQRNQYHQHYSFFDTNGDFQYTSRHYEYFHPIKKIGILDGNGLHLTMNGNLYINTLHFVEYRKKIKDIIRIPGVNFAIVIDEENKYFIIDKLGYISTVKPNITIKHYNVYDIHCNRSHIYYQLYFDTMLTLDSVAFYPQLSNNEIIPYFGLPFLVNYSGSKNIGTSFPKELKLKNEYEELDQTYRIFTSDHNYILLSFGVIEVDFDFIQQLSPFLNDDGSLAPLYNVKTIGGKSYLYTRNKNGEMIRCRVSYKMGTGEISEYLEEKK
jgi:hypothetical protein